MFSLHFPLYDPISFYTSILYSNLFFLLKAYNVFINEYIVCY
ncbi:hypothetical protein FM106_20505 [Brachybacterium faecium]|nr:hypothetical protein FM106_20505 [Brachybacterium faecium]